MEQKNRRRKHRIIQFRNQETEYWDNANQMHDALHKIPGYFRSLLPELLDRAMSKEEIMAYMKRLQQATGKSVVDDVKKSNLDSNLQKVVEQGILKVKGDEYRLTPAGREMAEFMQEVIPFFMNKIFSPQMVSLVTIFLHIILSAIKLVFGFISNSAGLVADGIDNTVDTVSSFLVWLGIRLKKERLASLIVIIMMFFSLGGIAIVTYHKIVMPGPIKEGIVTFSISALCGLLMLLLSAYQYQTGRKHSNFAIMCQAVDSRNHFYTSFLVCMGIILSYLAEIYHASWLYYADAAASSVIGLIILKSAIELISELNRPDGEPTHISHFLATAYEKVKKKAITEWLFEQLDQEPMTRVQLQERFVIQFCKKVPKVLILSEMGYRPQNDQDLWIQLDWFIQENKVALIDGKYRKL